VALLHSVVGNHGFTDGNKRTGWILTEILIERSGFVPNVADDEKVDDLGVGENAN
jgi:death-on-curing protein